MQRKQLSLYGPCCPEQNCLLYAECGGCNAGCLDAHAGLSGCVCSECGKLCRARRKLMSYASDADGPTFDVDYPSRSFPALPCYISQAEWSPTYALPPSGPYVIPLHHWLTYPRGRRTKLRTKEQLHQHLPCASLFLSIHGPDRHLHNLWADDCVPKDAWASIGEMGFSGVFGPDFSVWEDGPRAEHIIERKRSIIAAAAITDAGTAATPNIFMHNEMDIASTAEWLNSRLGVAAISTNVQRVHSDADMAVAAQRFARLGAKLTRRLSLTVIGLVQPCHVRQFVESGFRITVVNARAYHGGRNGHSYRVANDRIYPEDVTGAGQEEIYRRNHDFFQNIYADLMF